MRSASMLHDGAEPVLGDALEVARDVVAGEGVVLAAEAGDDLRELAERDLVRRLEHQVLEEVGDARDALGLVGGADLVPDHVRDDGCAVIRDHHDVDAVGELELARLRLRVGVIVPGAIASVMAVGDPGKIRREGALEIVII